ncbi:MAG: signal peptidase I [Eubacteriales bacterium]|nr:signal peptidase I [Eubacteriales bacterium]
MESESKGRMGRDRERRMLRNGFLRLAAQLTGLAAAGWLIFTQVFLVTQASGNSMSPAVRDGDLLLGFRMQGTYAKNDVVIYEYGGRRQIGRILGRAGDVIAIDGSGTVEVNGTAQSGAILYPTYAGEGISYPYTVPEECVFILGDYRTQAEDSRVFGAIPLEDMEAKVITLLRRRAL